MIYICIPTHNEAETVGVLLWKVRKVLGEFGRDYRLLVLDDASTDDTAQVLDRYRGKLPLTVIRAKQRMGYAAAVERLLHEAVGLADYPKRDAAVVLQADFTENPEDIVTLVKALEGGADIVAGSAGYDGEHPAPRGVSWVRKLARFALGRTLRSAPVSDPLNGMRAYRIIVLKKALRDLPAGERLLHTEGWAANVELLKRLVPHARRITEAPTSPRPELQLRPSRFRPLATLLALFKLRGTGWESGAQASGS
ncbi:MAG: glycosyltransferase family 2 protein [Gemmatimonadota bacterium]